MALVKCKECGAQVSTKAQACPTCGAALPKRTSLLTWLIGGMFAVIVVGAIDMQNRTGPAHSEGSAAQGTASQSTEDKAATTRYSAAMLAVKSLKKSAHDPSSVDIEFAGANALGTVVCLEFRAKNAFGALVKQFAVYEATSATLNDAGRWNKHCTANMYNLTRLVN